MGSIQWILDTRDPGRGDLSTEKLVNINDAEPSMVANVHISSCQATKSIRLSSDDQTLDQVLSEFMNHATMRETVLDLDNTFEETDLVCTVRIEGRAPHNALIDQHTESPVVNTLVMTLGQDNFWR